MKKLNGLIIILTLSFLGCGEDEGSSSNTGRLIADSFEADEVFNALDDYFASFQALLPEGTLNEPMLGLSGDAIAGGSKDVTSSSSSSSSSSSTLLDTYITFSAFTPEGFENMEITGTIRFFSYIRSRTACSSSGCASSSGNSRAIETRPNLDGEIEFIDISYQLLDGDWINDSISIDATSPSHTSRWTSVIFKTQSGQSFSL